jgi:hypothetical protein
VSSRELEDYPSFEEGISILRSALDVCLTAAYFLLGAIFVEADASQADPYLNPHVLRPRQEL